MPAFAREAGCGANVPPRRLSGGGAGAAPSLDAKFQVLPRAVIAPRPCRGFFLARAPWHRRRAPRMSMLRRSKIHVELSSIRSTFLGQRTHCTASVRISSTGCWPWRDAGRPLLTYLVRSVYVPDGRGDASQRDGHHNETRRSPRTHPAPIGPPMVAWLRCVEAPSSGRDAQMRQDADDDGMVCFTLALLT